MPWNSLCSFSPIPPPPPPPPPPPCGAWILRRGSLYQKHHSWMRRRPLRKISCHPFLKIFVNLVSSVCGFISTCINVSSLVTEPRYLGEDIIKNVFGPWGEGGRQTRCCRIGSAKRDGVGRGRQGGESREEEEGEGFPASLTPPLRESVECRASDKRQTGWSASLSSSRGGIAGVSMCCYLFNGTRPTDSAMEGKLVSLLTTHWHGENSIHPAVHFSKDLVQDQTKIWYWIQIWLRAVIITHP